MGFVADIAGGLLGSKGAKKQANAGAYGAEQAMQFGQQAYDRAQANYQPYMDMGLEGMNQYADVLFGRVDPTQAYQASPYYQVGKQQTIDDVTQSAAQLGYGNSGQARLALGQRLADYNTKNFDNYMQRLGVFGQVGMNAANALESVDMNTANMMGNAAQNAANHRSQGIENQYQAQNRVIGGFGGMLDSGMAMFSDQSIKEDIRFEGTSPQGIPVVTFKYKPGNKVGIVTDKRYRGVIAQDILKLKPSAVSHDKDKGLMKVNYSMIDVDLEEVV